MKLLLIIVKMFNRSWKQAQTKVHNTQQGIRKSSRDRKYKDEMKSAFSDEKELKKKKRRLSLDWFFRPQGD